MAGSVVSFIIERLGDLLIEEAEALREVNHGVEEIRQGLRSLLSVIKNAESWKYAPDVRVWLADVRALAYDASDVLEAHAIEIDKSNRKGFAKSIRNILKRYVCLLNESDHVIESKIANIKNRISELPSRLPARYSTISSFWEEEDEDEDEEESLSSSHYAGGSIPVLKRNYSHFVVDQEVVGLENDINELVAHLVSDQVHRVVAIHGMGGLGKTTLAKKIYNNSIVQNHFECLSWVSISQKWNKKEILRQIFHNLDPSFMDFTRLSEDELVKNILKIQSAKRCLVVLDDIWSKDAWNCLEAAFLTINSISSKILLTTRDKDVAEHVDPNGFLHSPKVLDEEQSLNLLLKKTCIKVGNTGIHRRDVKKMEALGREMIRHCGGLPLAILVLGGILVTNQRSLPAWESVHKSINTSLKADRGIGEDHEKEVLEILEWSYIYLPYQLKLCFLYLGQFPEDAEIQAEKLYQMWMAEGLLLQKDRRDGETMLDVAESYLAELAHKSMIGLEMEEYESSIRKFSSCRLHDLMRDLSRRKAEEEDFFSELDIRHGLQLQQSAESSSRRDHSTRRVVIVDGSEAVASKSKRVDINECLCSMILLDEYEHVDILVRFLRLNMSNFKLLRVLSLENLSNGSLEFLGVSQLTNLRYLSFRESKLKKLPVINSKHLQTLDLRVSVFSEKMDLSSMNNMRHDLRCLRHLYLPYIFETRIRLVGANNLETIENFDTKCCDIRDLSGISNLRKLKVSWIRELEGVEEMVKYLSSSSSSSLRYLSLWIVAVPGVISERGEDVLRRLFRSGSPSLHRLFLSGAGVLKLARVFNDDEDVNFLSSLTTLHIDNWRKLEGDPMRVLEKIPNLRTLLIEDVCLEEKEMVCSATGNAFSQLTDLILWGVKNWETWRVDEGAMPNLTSLRIVDCRTLEKLPDGLRFLTSLRELYIFNMPEEFQNRLKEGGEDFYNIPPLASVKFW